MNDFDAIKICDTCGYAEYAVRISSNKYQWESNLLSFGQTCQRKDGMPDECPNFKRADIRFPPAE